MGKHPLPRILVLILQITKGSAQDFKLLNEIARPVCMAKHCLDYHVIYYLRLIRKRIGTTGFVPVKIISAALVYFMLSLRHLYFRIVHT